MRAGRCCGVARVEVSNRVRALKAQASSLPAVPAGTQQRQQGASKALQGAGDAKRAGKDDDKAKRSKRRAASNRPSYQPPTSPEDSEDDARGIAVVAEGVEGEPKSARGRYDAGVRAAHDHSDAAISTWPGTMVPSKHVQTCALMQ